MATPTEAELRLGRTDSRGIAWSPAHHEKDCSGTRQREPSQRACEGWLGSGRQARLCTAQLGWSRGLAARCREEGRWGPGAPCAATL